MTDESVLESLRFLDGAAAASGEAEDADVDATEATTEDEKEAFLGVFRAGVDDTEAPEAAAEVASTMAANGSAKERRVKACLNLS